MSKLTTSSITGSAIGCIMNQSVAHLMTFSSVFYNNQTNNLPAIGSGSSTDGSEIVGFTCGALYSQILNFPKNIWVETGSLWNQTMLMVIPIAQQTLQQQTATTNIPTLITSTIASSSTKTLTNGTLTSGSSSTSGTSSTGNSPQNFYIQFYSAPSYPSSSMLGIIHSQTQTCFLLPSYVSNFVNFDSLQVNPVQCEWIQIHHM